MKGQEIICPNCLTRITLTEALMGPIESRLREEYEGRLERANIRLEDMKTRMREEHERDLREETSRIKESIRSKLAEQYELEIVEMKEELVEKKRKLESLMKREKELQGMKRAVEERERSLEDELGKRVEYESEKLRASLERELDDRYARDISELKEELKVQKDKLDRAREEELKLRRIKRDLEEKEKDIELEVERKLESERRRMEEAISERMTEQQRLRDAEKDKTITDLRDQIDLLKRKAEQGSQQLQGEVLELSVEELLSRNFPGDAIEPVPKGVRGADIIQRVHSHDGGYSGTILWELKRTKHWSEDWVDKLRQDQKELKADIAVICTQAMPRDSSDFLLRRNVLIIEHPLTLPVAHILRNQLFEMTRLRRSVEGVGGKMEMLYGYLTGPEFRQNLEGIMEAFMDMKNDLDREKSAMNRIWSKREKQMLRALSSLGNIYGSMQGIAGSSLPGIRNLELEELTDGRVKPDASLDEYR